jgi:hypothetical protein
MSRISFAMCSPALVGLALLAPQPASAGKVVLAPLLADDTINAKQRLGVHQLMASELDFAPEFDGVVDLNAAPPTLNDPCLSSAKCLQGIASANGGEQVISGKVTAAGESITLDLVYYDGSTIARRKAFTVPQDPTGLANAMTPILREMLTGAGTAQQQAASAPSESDFDLDDDVALGAAAGVAGGVAASEMLDDGLVDMEPVADMEPLEAAPTPVPASGRKSRGDDRRLAAASMATGLATGGVVAAGGAAGGAPTAPPAPAPPAPAPPPPDDELAKSLSFTNTASEITAEEIDSMIKFGPPPGTTGGAAPTPQPVVRGSGGSGTADVIAEEEAELDSMGEGLPDLDGGSRTRTTRTGGGSGGSGADIDHVVQLTARGGYSRYYSFNFLTGGGEVAVAAAKGFHLLAGVEMYAVQRTLPPDVASAVGIFREWNFIFPLNVGGLYKFPIGRVQPYVGADTIFVQYYKDEVGADWAVGGRVRAGADMMVHPNFGFNLNVAAGVWSGQNWGLIEANVGQTGFLPQVSAGTVVAF